MQNVIDVNIKTFQREVLDRSNDIPVVVDFWSPTCGPCMVLGPILEKLAANNDGKWKLAKVNTSDSQNQNLAMDFRIQGIPAVKAFKNGEVVDEFVGALPEAQIEEWLKKFIPNKADEFADAGIAALAADALDQAREIFERLKEMDAEDDRALLGLAEVSIREGDKEAAQKFFDEIPKHRIHNLRIWHAKVSTLIEGFGKDKSTFEERLKANPNDLEARFERATISAAEGEYEKAFEDLIFIVTIDREFRDEAARLTAIKLFEVVGLGSELATKWRKRLGRAMY